jgi:hypothetical protein
MEGETLLLKKLKITFATHLICGTNSSEIMDVLLLWTVFQQF